MSQKPKSSCSCLGTGCLLLVVLLLVGAGYSFWRWGPQLMDMSKDPEKSLALIKIDMHRDYLEVVKVDDENRTITFKIKSSGETVTATFKAIVDAKVVVIDGKTQIHGLDQPAAESPPATGPPVQ